MYYICYEQDGHNVMNKGKRGEFFEAKFSLREENGIQIIFLFIGISTDCFLYAQVVNSIMNNGRSRPTGTVGRRGRGKDGSEREAGRGHMEKICFYMIFYIDKIVRNSL